jgi:hypothetical protein
MNLIFEFHSIVRWIIVLLALAAALRFAIGWLTGGFFDRSARLLSGLFSGLIDLQAVAGLLLLIWSGMAGAGFPAYRIEHTLTMTAAAVVAHLPSLWKRSADRVRFRNSLIAVLLAMAIIYLGVARLPGGWVR